jgi:hypothetical protein
MAARHRPMIMADVDSRNAFYIFHPNNSCRLIRTVRTKGKDRRTIWLPSLSLSTLLLNTKPTKPTTAPHNNTSLLPCAIIENQRVQTKTLTLTLSPHPHLPRTLSTHSLTSTPSKFKQYTTQQCCTKEKSYKRLAITNLDHNNTFGPRTSPKSSTRAASNHPDERAHPNSHFSRKQYELK